MAQKIGSILHGAYGDYYWQATSLKLLLERNPGTQLYLFSADPARLPPLQKFDFSFANVSCPGRKCRQRRLTNSCNTRSSIAN